MAQRLNAQLPPGVAITDCRPVTDKSSRLHPPATVSYQIFLRQGRFDAAKLDAFMGLPDPTVTVNRPKGRLKKIAIKDILVDISLLADTQLNLTLASVPGKSLRPAELITTVFSLPESQLKRARIIKKR